MGGKTISRRAGYDVLIIGGGPAGLSAAFFLSAAGIPCAVVERKREIGRPVQCAEAISKRSFEASGLFDPASVDTTVQGFKFYLPSMKFFTCRTEGYILNRGAFEQRLAAMAAANGAAILTGTHATALSETKDGFMAETNAGIFTGKVLFGADGPKSLTENMFFKNTFRFVPALQFVLPGDAHNTAPDPWLAMYLDPLCQYYFWIFRKKEAINAGGVTGSRDALVAFLGKHGHSAASALNTVRGLIPVSGIKKRIQRGRVLLLGDAAGLTNPVTFAGIHSALISGRYAADAAAMYFKTGATKHLEQYAAKMFSLFGGRTVRYIARRCYAYPAETLDFIGAYLDDGDFSTIAPCRFAKNILKYPAAAASLLPLLLHRNLLATAADNLW